MSLRYLYKILESCQTNLSTDISHRVMCLMLLVGGCAIASMVYWGLSIEHWRHDSLMMLSEAQVQSRVYSEGRWVNALVFPINRMINPSLAWLANLLFLGSAVFLIFNRIIQDRLVALNATLLCLLFPGLYALNMWPNHLLPSTLFSFAGVLALQRYGAKCLPVLGILLFGSMPIFYYLLPLAFMPLKNPVSGKDVFSFIAPGSIWMLGLALGYLVAASISFLFTGHFGLQLETWRVEFPANDLDSLIENIRRSAASLELHVHQWLPFWSLVSITSVVLVLGSFARCRFGNTTAIMMRSGYAGVLILSPYVTLLQSGLETSLRSTISLGVGTVALPYLVSRRAFHRPLTFILMFVIGIPSFVLSNSGVKWFAEVTELNIKNIANALPENRSDLNLLVIDGRKYEEYFNNYESQIGIPRSSNFLETLYTPYRMKPAFRTFWSGPIALCPKHKSGENEEYAKRCADYDLDSYTSVSCETKNGSICAIGDENGVLILRLMPE